MKNQWGKSRKRDNPYYEVTVDDWTWKVLKVWGDPRKPYARAFCVVTSPFTGSLGDMGDVYANEVPGLIAAWNHAHQEARE